MSDALVGRIAKVARQYGFFQLVRALEQALGGESTLGDARALEKVAFTHVPSLAFPRQDVVKVTSSDGVLVATSFLGLLGTGSPLSPEWTEEVTLGDDEGALGAFYDVFHHRITSYLVLAWKTHTSEGAFDDQGRDVLSARLRSMAGVDAWMAVADDALPPMMALGVADHQYGHGHTIDREAAERLLQRFFPACHLRLETNVARSVAFTQDERARLGIRNSKLDGSLVYGSRCADTGGIVRIHLGPLDATAYEAFMPGGQAYASLAHVATRVFGGVVDVELEVYVEPDAAPRTTLGAERGTRLGVDTRYGTSRVEALSVRVPLGDAGAKAERHFILHDEGA